MSHDLVARLRWHIVKGAALGGMIAVLSVLQDLANPSSFALHAIYLRVYYIPIVLGALWYGPAGGLVTAVVSVIACALEASAGPWGTSPFSSGEYAEYAVFLFVGAAVGVLAASDRRRRSADGGPRAEGGPRGWRASPFPSASLGPGTPAADPPEEHGQRIDRVSGLGSIAAGLAQEIQRPLAGLKNAVEAGLPAPPGDRGDKDVSLLARRELRRLETLVNRLIAYARPSEPHFDEVSLSEVLKRVCGRLNRQAERRGVSLEVETETGLPALVIDARQIEQAVFNVTLNAVQASGPGGCVRICARRGHRLQSLEICDEGPGIAREYQERIFEPFFTTKERGMGLGLAIARRIVDSHYGTIDVQRAPRGGTVVRIELPEIESHGRRGLSHAVESQS